MLYQQPQSGPVDLDLSGPALGTISTLLPIFKSNDLVRTAVLAAPGRFTPTTTPAAFSFTSSSASVIGYTDTDSGQFRRSTFTMVLRFRLNSLTAGSIFNVDSRFNIGVGVESIPAGNLGVSWYDGTFRVLSTTATLGMHTLIAQATTGGMSLWIDGVLIGTTASGAIVYQGGRGCTYGAVDYFGNPGAIFDLQIANYNGLGLPSATVSQVAANPWMLLLDPDEDDDLLFATGGATNTQVTPAAGAIALTGYVPTVARTANQTVAPGVGSLSITGYAPLVTQGATTAIAPGAGSLSLIGYAPSIAQSANQSVTPNAGALTLTGYAPTLAQSANQALSPAAGAMAITGYAPVVTQVSASPSLVPGAGSITITGYEPTITQSGGAGRPKKAFQVETSRGVIEVATMDEVAQIVRTEKRRPKAAPVEVKLEGMKVSTPSLKPNVDYKAIEERTRAQVQAEMDDEEELLMMLL